ncbi:UNVERIFIED_ORG: ABC-2 type transport system permease protein [Nocardia globerula]|uniref:Transport permease protein n=1 Tax=Nocardia globerula TaxID=1818 RepID=A0A652YRC2_NOCGL|nr:ABC transporter permease [Rhodococcus globerulus]NMD63303.1 ABC transporter permease [Nocardia globerula]PVX62868.1 ABC-2 type transport system permease protein [Rhodococcus globerulus]
MTTATLAYQDSKTMLRRSIRHIVRYPSMTVMLVGMPVVFLLLFVYVLGGTLGNGLTPGGGGGGRAEYVNYVAPAIILMTVAAAAQGTAISVATDMTAGIIARFRTMAITRTSVLTGHVLGSLLQTIVSLFVVIAVAVAVGFRPSAGVVEWVATFALLILVSIAMIWLSVAFGLVSKSVETASNLPMVLILLPFLGSGFVPTESMPTVLRWFAEYQPFTPIIETLRGLLLGEAIGNNAILAVAWCVAITFLSYLWARSLFNRRPVR